MNAQTFILSWERAFSTTRDWTQKFDQQIVQLKRLQLLLPALLLLGCASQRLNSPVDLPTAIRTLPAEGVAGMSKKGREEYLERTPGRFYPELRRLHYYSDMSGGIDSESMLYLRLFEDANGRTVAASHSARPRASWKNEPSPQNTNIYVLESGRWRDITDSVLPNEVGRDWFFRFDVREDRVPCGAYIQKNSGSGHGQNLFMGDSWGFGEETHWLRWDGTRFVVDTEGRSTRRR